MNEEIYQEKLEHKGNEAYVSKQQINTMRSAAFVVNRIYAGPHGVYITWERTIKGKQILLAFVNRDDVSPSRLIVRVVEYSNFLIRRTPYHHYV